ncbi:MAG: amidohydrolase [Oscillospiraceae bacterium]|nr:amidohydrolase [Candidatus Equicaccousia limihippi]
MLFKNITIIDENFNVQKNRFVATDGDVISYIGTSLPQGDFGEIYDGNNKLLIPAFYDAHSHLPMFLMRGYGENLPLMDWLCGKIFPFEAHWDEESMYYSTLAGIAEMLRYGIADTTEMYLSHEPLGRAYYESGAKTTFSVCCLENSDVDFRTTALYKDTVDAINKYDGLDGGRIRVQFSLHAEYTTSEKITKTLAQAAAEHNSSIHVHVSETAGEVADCKERHRKSPVKYLADCGIFDVPTVAAHCVHIDDDDIQILKNHNVTVATCPKGNAKLSSGICPVTKLISSGVNVAIGTDSVASNNNLNMIEEMRFFNLLQKASTFDPTVVTPAQTLYAATRAGALGAGREDCGFIKEGFKADLCVLDIDKPYMKPEYNLLNNLIYSASGNDVVLTMVDGKVLYKNGVYTTLDTEKIYYECEKAKNRILGEINGK